MKTVRWPHEKAKWFFERGPYPLPGGGPTLLAGGINAAKTVTACLKMLALTQRYPGSRGALVRKTGVQLTKTLMETWFQWCDPGFYRPIGGFNANTGTLDMNNGSRIYFLHLDAPDSLNVLAGLELNFAYVSQAEEISEKAWDLLDVRIGRWTGATIPPEEIEALGGPERWPWRSQDGSILTPPRYLFAESYVTDEAHWLYDRFAEESPNRSFWKSRGYECRIVNSDENVFANKETLEAAKSKDDDYIRRYVRPEWGNPEGAIFSISGLSLLEYTPDLVDRIKRAMKLHRSMDHGDTAPTCVLWEASDHDGNIFVFREYYEPNRLVVEHRQTVWELSKDDPRYHSQMADPSIFAKSRGRTATGAPTWSIADEWSDIRTMPPQTAIAWQAAENDEAVTVARMKEYLRVDPNHRHPITGTLGAPRLYFVMKSSAYPNGCDMVVKEIRAQRRKKASVAGDRNIWLDERDDKIVDHAYDTIKYHVVHRPSLGPTPPPKALEPGFIALQTFKDADKAERRRAARDARRLGPGDVRGWG